MAGKVRPFDRDCDVDGQQLHIRGTIEGDRFIVTAELIRLEIKAAQIGIDEKGMFAVLEETEWLASDGMICRVEHDYDEPLPNGDLPKPGLVISRTKVASDATVELIDGEILRQTKKSPFEFNVIYPNEWSLRIYFDSVGQVNGC